VIAKKSQSCGRPIEGLFFAIVAFGYSARGNNPTARFKNPQTPKTASSTFLMFPMMTKITDVERSRP
jgi:hypothetical protein